METAPLSREQVDQVLEKMRQMLADKMGVTLVEDHNGAYGQLGQRHLTVRFGDHTVSMTINQVSSYREDQRYEALMNEDK